MNALQESLQKKSLEELIKLLIEPEIEENDNKVISALKIFVPKSKKKKVKSAESEEKTDEKTDN